MLMPISHGSDKYYYCTDEESLSNLIPQETLVESPFNSKQPDSRTHTLNGCYDSGIQGEGK